MMSKIRSRLLICFFVIHSNIGFSQGEANIWYFGANAGLDFNSGYPIALTNGKLSNYQGTASICSPEGKLLFYTDGYILYDSTHQKMPNSKDERYNKNWTTTQSALIVPMPDSSHIYYLFTNEAILANGYSSNFFHYSIINMNLNAGKGDVVLGKRRITLLHNSSQKLTGAKHANGKDYWIVSDKLFSHVNYDSGGIFSDSIYAWQLTSAGLKNPVITKSGFKGNRVGDDFMKISPNGKKIALTRQFDSILVADFDNNTGNVSNIWVIKYDLNRSLEFSQLSNYLYANQGGSAIRKLFQYNAQAKTKAEFIQSKKLIDSAVSNKAMPLQLGPDGKIYEEESGTGYLHIIHAPDSAGVQCRFKKNAVYLAGKTTKQGLPNFLPVFLRKYNPTIGYKTACAKDTSYFTIDDYNFPDSLRWDFGDPATGSFNTSTNHKSVYHIYLKSGAYTVKLFIYYSGKTDSLMVNITIDVPRTNFDVKDVCEKDTVYFINNSTPKNKLTYRWKFGDGQSSLVYCPAHLYPSRGFSITYNVTLVATIDGRCSDSITKPVTVNAKPNSDFNFSLTGTQIDLKATKTDLTKYEWKFGKDDSIVSTATYSHNINLSFHKQVCLKVTDASGCQSVTCKDVTVGIFNISKPSGFKIYPNPNHGNFTIEIKNPTIDMSIEVYDVLGQLFYKTSCNAIKSNYNIDLIRQTNPFGGLAVVRVTMCGAVWNQIIKVGYPSVH